MSDPQQQLSYRDIENAGLSDWRQIAHHLRARFATGDFATGLALVDRIGAAAEAANHHPDVTLTYPSVEVSLRSHDVGALTSRDVELAREISGFAADAGVRSDSDALSIVEFGLDTHDHTELVGFWAAVLGTEAEDGADEISTGNATVWFQSSEPDDRTPSQRWHPDVWIARGQVQARLDAAVAAGGTLVTEEFAPRFWVLADPQGNKVCLCTDEERR